MKKTILLLSLATTVMLYSCKKSEEVICNSGSGGHLTVKVIPEFNGAAVMGTEVDPVSAYLAFETSVFPGQSPEKYNRTFVEEENNAFINCTGLHCGVYYFYVTATDPATGDKIAGGTSLVTSQQEGTAELKIQLTTE